MVVLADGIIQLRRPPTPPKIHGGDQVSRQLADSIPTPNTSTESTIDRQRKKVGWSVEERSTPSGKSTSQPRSSDSKPVKSILKPRNVVGLTQGTPDCDFDLPQDPHERFAAMLESVVRQLASEDRSSRLDSYMVLSGIMKASSTVPGISALRDKIGLLMQFILRDILAKTQSGSPDTTLVTGALGLLASLLYSTATAAVLSNEFCVAVIDHSILAFQDPAMPKETIRHLLFIVSEQNFHARVMTQERLGRLITSLNGLESVAKGKSILGGRILAYKKILKQSRPSMLANTSWMENLLTDMLSSFSDLRSQAVAFGLEAALSLGTEKQTSRAVMEVFLRENNERRVGDHYAEKLTTMVKKKQGGVDVPRIWSVVILFFRSRSQQLEHWEFMKPWLKIIQDCYNNSDNDVKIQANLAWNRLVFAISPNEKTTPAIVKMLAQPVNAQLTRKLAGKHAREAQQAAISSVTNLLYYTLNPTATWEQLDRYWDAYVVHFIKSMLQPQRNQADGATAEEERRKVVYAILQALLDPTPSRAWDENRANEEKLVLINELPALDAKWTRRNSQRVIEIIEPLIHSHLVSLPLEALNLWDSFSEAVAVAGFKEIIISTDTMISVASILGVLYRIWQVEPHPMVSSESTSGFFITSFGCLITRMLKILGVLPFTEKPLAITQQHIFTVVSTPTHRPTKLRGDIKYPLHHLFSLIMRSPSNVVCDVNYTSMVSDILEPFFRTRESFTSQVAFIRDLLSLLPESAAQSTDSVSAIGPALAMLVASAASKGKGDESNLSGGSHDQPLGAQYKTLTKVLELAVNSSLKALSPVWREAYAALSSHIFSIAGVSGVALALIDPLAKSIGTKLFTGKSNDITNSIFRQITKDAKYPKDQQALDYARRQLWGTTVSGRQASSDPFVHLYECTQLVLRELYDDPASDIEVGLTLETLVAIERLLRTCPVSNVVIVLAKVQKGIAPWIEDNDARFRMKSDLGSITGLSTRVGKLWDLICNKIAKQDEHDARLLKFLAPLVCAGLASSHKPLVNRTIELWNTTFGKRSELEYPEEIVQALQRLRSVADLSLPCFPIGIDEVSIEPPTFLESQQDDDSLYAPMTSVSAISSSPLRPSPFPKVLFGSSPGPLIEVQQSISRKRGIESMTPEGGGKRKAAKREQTPRLRHDDSQIQFAAIDSSPIGGGEFADGAGESQLLLTDRQREVRERQLAEAATSMFPDIRRSSSSSSSSPIRGKEVKTPRRTLTLSSDRRHQSKLLSLPLPSSSPSSVGAPSTPMMVSRATNAGFDYFGSTSPTPRRNPTSSLPGDGFIDDVPSSSPAVVVLAVDNPASEVSLHDVRLVSSSMPVPSSPIPIPSSPPPTTMMITTTETSSLTSPPRREVAASANAINLSESPKTPGEVFVDALSSPVLSTPGTNLAHDAYVDALSSPAADAWKARSLPRANIFSRMMDLEPATPAEDETLLSSSFVGGGGGDGDCDSSMFPQQVAAESDAITDAPVLPSSNIAVTVGTNNDNDIEMDDVSMPTHGDSAETDVIKSQEGAEADVESNAAAAAAAAERLPVGASSSSLVDEPSQSSSLSDQSLAGSSQPRAAAAAAAAVVGRRKSSRIAKNKKKGETQKSSVATGKIGTEIAVADTSEMRVIEPPQLPSLSPSSSSLSSLGALEERGGECVDGGKGTAQADGDEGGQAGKREREKEVEEEEAERKVEAEKRGDGARLNGDGSSSSGDVIAMLKKATLELRGAALERGQLRAVEDAFVEFRRAMYEAGDRG